LITKANGISHEAAHDALSDVYATIAVAKLIKDKQPKLFDYVFEHKKKQKISGILNLYNPEVVLHTSGMYPSTICNTTVVYPLAQHPTNKNGIIVFDLRFSPEDLKNLPAEEIIERLYTPRDQLPEGVERIPLKTIHINKCPVVAPVKTLDEASKKRTQIDKTTYMKHLSILQSIPDLDKKLNKIYNHNPFTTETDPDKSLYGGGFFSPDDKKRMDDLRQLNENELKTVDFNFKDTRIPEMLFRYRARNYPDSLSQVEKDKWNKYRKAKFTYDNDNKTLNIETFNNILDSYLSDNELSDSKREILLELTEWKNMITQDLNIS